MDHQRHDATGERHISILNRGAVIRLVAMGSFFCSIVFATDSNLLLFYIEDQLNVRDKDNARRIFFVMGMLGIMFQAFLLHPLTQCLKEKGLLATSFLPGTLHSLLYGLARDERSSPTKREPARTKTPSHGRHGTRQP